MNDELLFQFIEYKNKINKLSAQLSENKIVAFNDVSLKKPELKCPVHGFYTCVSWLYVIYFEVGKSAIDFLTEQAISRSIGLESFYRQHKILVNHYRTFLQHNLNLQSKKDLIKKENCVDWLQSQLDVKISWPTNDEHWKILTESLLRDSFKFISYLFSSLDLLSKDESYPYIIQIWLSRINRQISPHEYDDIIEQVLYDFGQKNLDTGKIRKVHIQKWNRKLKARGFQADLKKEARCLVEQTLMDDENIPIPVNGKDIIEELNIQPGPIIKDILQHLTENYKKHPMDKTMLLDLALEYFNNHC